MKILFFGFLLGAAVAAPVAAQDATPRVSEIAAGGRGEVRIVPDHAILVVSVENNASTAAAAAAENARLVAATLKSLRSAGVKDAEMSNGRYSVAQDFENGDRRRPKGFVARNSIRIELPRIPELGTLVDAALAGGATTVSPIQFLGPDMPGARRDALKAAVAEARRDAEIMAEASGGSLGRLLSMTTGFASPGTPRYGDAVEVSFSASSGPPTSIRPGDLVVSATANGRWEFVPRR